MPITRVKVKCILEIDVHHRPQELVANRVAAAILDLKRTADRPPPVPDPGRTVYRDIDLVDYECETTEDSNAKAQDAAQVATTQGQGH